MAKIKIAGKSTQVATTQQHYRNSAGQYLGSWECPDAEDGSPQDNPAVPVGAIACPKPPSGKAVWNEATGAWDWPDEWRDTRRRMYENAGLSIKRRDEAVAQFLLDGDSTVLDQFKLEREAVRADPDFPAKP